MNFYQYNRKIKPSEVSHYAISYMLCILNTLLKYNKDNVNEFSKTIKKATAEYCSDYKDRMKSESKESQQNRTAASVVAEFNKFCSSQPEAQYRAEQKALAKPKSVAPKAETPADDIPDIELNKSVHSDTPKEEAKAAEGQEGETAGEPKEEEGKGEEEKKDDDKKK